MYEGMNMGKGFLVPQGNEAMVGGYWMETPSQGSLPIDCLESLAGSSNWQGILADGPPPYSQPLLVQNHNTAFHDFNGSGQASLPGTESSSSGNRNGGLNQIHETYPQPLNVDDTWDQLLSLMTAPSSAMPENFMPNRSMKAITNHVRMPDPGNQQARPLMKAPYALQSNGTASSSARVEASHLSPTSYSQGSNLMQPMMKAPCVGTWNAMHNKSLNAYPQESSYQMQRNVAGSPPLAITSIQRQSNCLPYTMQEGFPVCYDPRYNLNHAHVDAPVSITSSSHFAPQTPQPAKRSHHQCSAEMVLSLGQSQNQNNALQDDLAISSITQSSQFAPATPQLAKAADNYQCRETQCLSVDQIQKQGEVQLLEHAILPASLENESTTHDCQELLQSILDSSSTAVGTSLRETNSSENEENQNIDLNKTPSKKTPRRKKHRPKVIRENKPPRNRKPAKDKVGPDGTPVPKRKYVRKGKSNPIETPEQDVGEEPKDSTTERASKICRRSLNYELENNIIDTPRLVDQEEKQNERQENILHNVIAQEADDIFQNAVTQEAGLLIGSNHFTGINTALQCSQRNVQIRGNKEAKITTNLPPSIHQLQREIYQSSQHILGTHPVMRNWQTNKSYTSTSNEVNGVTALSKRTVNGYQIPGHHPLYAGVGQALFHKMTAQERLERTRQTIEQIQQQRVSGYIQSRGSKRDYILTKENGGSGNSMATTNSQLLSQEIFQNEHMRTNSRLDQCYSGTHKRKRIENLNHTANSSIQYSARFAHNCSSQGQRNGYPVDHVLEANGGAFNSYHKSNTSARPGGDLCHLSGELNPDPASPCINLLRQSISSEASLGPEKLAERQARISALARVISSLNARGYPNVQNQMPSNHVNSRTQSQAIETTNRSNHAIVPIKKQNKAPIPPKPVASKRGSHLKQKNTVSVDDITNQLKCLDLNSTNNGMMKDEQKALVLYKADGTIVPYEGFDPLKRRKPRPKVDLDPETNRVWNLLMGKEASPDENQTDEQKTKWWEEQRKVFRGRADSFIARMHLVQGDRRFSPWKGSVVDSVIGVFLTQNVTDHLSSSAFMSLVANFPSQSIRRNITSGMNRLDVLVEEPQMCMLETYDKIQKDERFKYQATSYRAPNNALHQQKQQASVDCIQTSFRENNLDELVSSQDSAESSNVRMNGAVQSLFMSDLIADCQTNGYQPISRYSKMSFIIEEMENRVSYPNFSSQESGSSCYKTSMNGHLQLRNEEASQQKQPDGTYPFDLNRPQPPAPNISSSSCRFPAPGGLRLSDTDNGNMPENQHCISVHSNTASKHMGKLSTGTEQGVQVDTGLFHSEKTWTAEPATENSYTLQRKSISAAENGVYIQNKSVESNLKEQDCPSTEASSRTKTNMSKEKGRKAEGVKKTEVDWDCLRRQVKSIRKERERSQDTMNSIDYEALRCADVKKISDVIKERGMNNMLADRMKDFLERLVKDHGSVDLEWLRDAPPDKAKDYLLSIRGLGLKSVECIRLLTLHQHAFPVDTNVGRIAVRLGWVPLQPLPESLQLHLLEMYPMLESIQKYLYPRLLHLDQPTLYELHYQLITFGKVFCTKSKPNCNACPMRGECRHFASAFASSRLALPGPEEKSIVTSNTPIDTSRNPSIGVSPLPLPSLQDVKPEEAVIAHRTCEPIVEEPTTPEPDITEFSEILDIEESFYEDPDEIPTIRLNVEEFTQNLQNFMQENMELQEGDMSKALVSFDPKAASIPTPKLKNVSRLRTEHQVYQLPDSHPLLKGLDKREADDPSPYLLAIWTPGETANSIQPPEGICNFQESGQLCGENACFTCNSIRESNAQTVRGTILVPCRTAMRGSFPLNGTYFQVNEVFADHESSLKPIDVPREMIWNLPRRTVYFGTSVSAIFKGMSTEDIQQCFWRGFICVRGFDQKTRLPRPLMARLHFSANKQMRGRKEIKKAQNN